MVNKFSWGLIEEVFSCSLMEDVHYGEQLSWGRMEEVYTQMLTGIVETMTELGKALTLGALGLVITSIKGKNQ